MLLVQMSGEAVRWLSLQSHRPASRDPHWHNSVMQVHHGLLHNATFQCAIVPRSVHNEREQMPLLCRRDAGAALQAAESEAATLCRWLLARSPPLDQLAAVLAERPRSSNASGLAPTQRMAALWPALLQAATLPVSAVAAPDALAQLLQVRVRGFSASTDPGSTVAQAQLRCAGCRLCNAPLDLLMM